MQLLTVFISAGDRQRVLYFSLLIPHICQTPRNLHHFYAKACHLCIILALLKCVFKKKKTKAPQQWVPVYTVYFFQHPSEQFAVAHTCYLLAW